MSHKSYRINTKINNGDTVLKVNLKQGIDTLKVLSLEVNTEDAYQRNKKAFTLRTEVTPCNQKFEFIHGSREPPPAKLKFPASSTGRGSRHGSSAGW